MEQRPLWNDSLGWKVYHIAQISAVVFMVVYLFRFETVYERLLYPALVVGVAELIGGALKYTFPSVEESAYPGFFASMAMWLMFALVPFVALISRGTYSYVLMNGLPKWRNHFCKTGKIGEYFSSNRMYTVCICPQESDGIAGSCSIKK